MKASNEFFNKLLINSLEFEWQFVDRKKSIEANTKKKVKRSFIDFNVTAVML